MPFRIALLDDYQGVALAMAGWESLVDCEVVSFRDHVRGEDQLAARLQDFDAVVLMRERTAFPGTLVRRLPKLKLLVTTGMRNAVLDAAAAGEAGIVVCGTGGQTSDTAELTWALILGLARGVLAEDAGVRAGGWQQTIGAGLRGSTLALLGLGRIGAEVAAVGRAFGMRIIAWSPNLSREHAAEHGAELVSQQELFAAADFLSIHLVLGERSLHAVGEPELRSMKPGAYLVNTSRGPIVEETALLRALYEGWIAGAGLDVYDVEPLPPDHPLRKAPRTLLMPHMGYVTEQNYRILYGEALDDVRAFLAGSPIRRITG